MKKAHAILAIMLTTCAFNLKASNIKDTPQCPLSVKTFEKLSDTGATNIHQGWNKIAHPEKRNISQLFSSHPYEIGVPKIAYGAAQVIYGTGQVIIGDTIKATIEHPDKAIITQTILVNLLMVTQ